MIAFSREFQKRIETEGKEIFSFGFENGNIDPITVESFGKEWKKFDFFDQAEIKKIGDEYFDILPEEIKNGKSTVLDAGCGTGRWAAYLASYVGCIECIDPSDAVYSAARLLSPFENIRISKVDISNLPFKDESFDFVYSIGVLHHIPDTFMALQACVDKIKKGGYFYVYLYYNLDNRNFLFRMLFHFSNLLRRVVCKLPGKIKRFVCDLLAIILYMPFVGLCRFLRIIGVKKRIRQKMPLFGYENKNFYIIRNDALDRFGTPLEQRFSKKQIQEMMEKAGLENILFSENLPYWHAIGKKK